MEPSSRSRSRLVGQPLLYAISIFASLGVFLFGYDQGVMSGVITGPHFRKFFNSPGAIEIGTMVAVLEIGAFITSLAAGRVGDVLGRRGTLLVGAIVFAVGGGIQTFTPGFWVMVLGRIIAGFGVGLLSYVYFRCISLDSMADRSFCASEQLSLYTKVKYLRPIIEVHWRAWNSQETFSAMLPLCG